MSDNWKAYLDLTLAMIIVGSSVVFGKVIVAAFPVFLASGMRFAIATLIIVPIILKKEGSLPRLKPNSYGILTIMAFAGQFMFTVLLLVGLKLTSAIEAGLITSTTPAAMGLVTFMVLREPLSTRQWIGILMAMFGVMAVNGFLIPGQLMDQTDYRHLLGNLLVCLAVVGEAVFLLLKKKLPEGVSSLATTGILSVLGMVMFLMPAIYQATAFDFGTVGWLDWSAIFYFGAVFTVVAYLLWFRGVSRVSGGTAGVFTAVMPVSAMLLSMLFLGETLSASSLLGIGFVLAAIFLMTISPGNRLSCKKPNHAASQPEST